MRKILLLAMVLFLFLTSYAQWPTKRPPRYGDSLNYYKSKRDQLIRQAFDSLQRSEKFETLTKKINQFKLKYPRYAGFFLTNGIMHNDFGQLNADLKANGFEEFPRATYFVGIGTSFRTNRMLYDLSIFIGGLVDESKKGNEVFSSSLANFLQFDWGYDLINKRNFALYPYAGISYRASNLSYKKPPIVNANFSNLSQIVTNNQSFNTSSNRLGYQYGIGMDFRIKSSNPEAPFSFLFIKVGTNQAFGGEKYNINGYKYRPDIHQADWLVAVGIKYVGSK